jgi:hypothetical protein
LIFRSALSGKEKKMQRLLEKEEEEVGVVERQDNTP